MSTRGNAYVIRNEMYSDGSKSDIEKRFKSDKKLNNKASIEELRAQLKNDAKQQKLDPNPGAAQVWLEEKKRGAPWRAEAEKIERIEYEKAKNDMERKQIAQLAKQTSMGLRNVCNVKFDVADLIPIVQDARNESMKPNPDPKKAALWQAIRKFDMKSVGSMLEAYDRSEPATPSLAITCNKPYIMRARGPAANSK